MAQAKKMLLKSVREAPMAVTWVAVVVAVSRRAMFLVVAWMCILLLSILLRSVVVSVGRLVLLAGIIARTLLFIAVPSLLGALDVMI